MTLTGSGNGWFITNGKAEKITWKKDQKKGRTTYLDKSGKEIVLNQGKTWVCIIRVVIKRLSELLFQKLLC